ncbi:HD-GYP domain-containing protein, partial [Salinispira pacifica]
QSGRMFEPSVAQAFMSLSSREGFWYRLQSPTLEEALRPLIGERSLHLDGGEVLEIARLFAAVVDSRSRFTARHSSAVAEVAAELGRLAGLAPDEIMQLRIAGYLHDIGKLAVPVALLNKPAPLTSEEMLVMRVHPYYTFEILDRVHGFRRIRDCAAFHHERLDGSGYPFHLGDAAINLSQRIIQLADVFTALLEDRPYRSGLGRQETIALLCRMRDAGELDSRLTDCAVENYELLAQLRMRAHESDLSNVCVCCA